MNFKTYIYDKLIHLILVFLMILTINFFLFMFKVSINLMIIIMITMILFIVGIISYDYYHKKVFYHDFCVKLDQLDNKYLILELIKRPEFIEGQLLYDSLYDIDKSMYEEIETYLENIKNFKEYIELWIHEVKIPIASTKLMIHNNEKNQRKFKEQINKIENYVEQVLYYTRLENSEQDYLIKECNLGDIIRNVIKRNQDSLLYQKIRIEVNDIDEIVLSDSKWLEFIINQVVSNSIKYHCHKNAIIIFKVTKDENINLEIIDNGLGIKASDIRYVFDKSFTGDNGRLVSSSTGMGLYLSKSLCNKLGHLIKIESKVHEYTRVIISFGDNQYYKAVR